MQITNSDGYDCGTPCISPNGKLLALTSNRDGNYHIFYFSLEKPTQWTSVSSSGNNSHPTWAQDNKRLAYVSTRNGKNEVFVYDTVSQKEFSVTDKFLSAGQPCWHPHSNKIVFCGIVKSPPVFDGRTDLYIYDLKTKVYEQITPADDNINESHPNWSKKGDAIYFNASNIDYSGGMPVALDCNIYKYEINNKKTLPVTIGKIFYSYPTATFDQDKIIFLRHEPGFRFTILEWNTKTGNYTELTFGNVDKSPCFGLYNR